jgi:RHS repeat-associated protein
LHVDHLGSLVLVTAEGGAVVRSLRYGPYGEIIEIGGTEAVPQGFATGEAAAAGLVLLGMRWYCPRIGRFLSPDPVVGDAFAPLSWNAYAYARSNPTSYIDPTGRSAVKIVVGVVALLAIAAVIIVVSVATFGAGGFAAPAVIMGSAKLTWGAVFAATIVGIVAGGTIGALAVKTSKGGEWDDIVLGALVGAAVGGWAAFGGTWLGGFAAGVGPKLVGKAFSGVVNGAVQNAAIGLASSYEGGMNNNALEILGKMATYAGIGAASGGIAKFASGVLQQMATVPKWAGTAGKYGSETGAQVWWAVSSKLALKALDKTILEVAKGMSSGQTELIIDFITGATFGEPTSESPMYMYGYSWP